MIVGIIGSGGREHAICETLIKSSKVKELFCFPGNAGTAKIAENVDLDFTEDGINTIAHIASEVNSSVENIGARRLHTIIERVLDEISFTATDRAGEKITVDGKYIKENIGELVKDTDLSKFIL